MDAFNTTTVKQQAWHDVTYIVEMSKKRHEYVIPRYGDLVLYTDIVFTEDDITYDDQPMVLKLEIMDYVWHMQQVPAGGVHRLTWNINVMAVPLHDIKITGMKQEAYLLVTYRFYHDLQLRRKLACVERTKENNWWRLNDPQLTLIHELQM